MEDKKDSIKWSDLVHFNPKQKEADAAIEKYKYCLYGGAMGGGKSYWLRWSLIKLLLKFHYTYKQRGVRVGLFCEDYPSLNDRHISKISYDFPTWLGTLDGGAREYVLRDEYGGGVMALRNLDDASKYASSEFAAIGVDELTKNKKEVFDMLRTRMRWKGIPDTKFIAATNPGSIGHAWVKKKWMDKEHEETEKEAHLFHYVRATAEDNRMNLDKTYFDQLEGLPAEQRKAFLMGDWNLFAGQFFSEWNEDIHVIDPFNIPDTWRKFGAYDHGRAKPATFGWYAMDFDGNIYKYRELYVNKEDGSSRWEAEQIAKEIVKINNEAKDYLEYVVADSAIWTNIGTAETIAEILQKHGVGKQGTLIPMMIPCTKGQGSRVNGWAIMHQYLYHDLRTPPKMKYFRNCYDSIRTIPSLIYSEVHMEDLDSDGEDHCFTGDTLIDTIWGKKKIKDLVGKSIYVNTLNGFRKSRNIRKTRKTMIYTAIFNNGVKVNATPEHLFLTARGWIELKDILLGYDSVIQLDICIKSYLELFKNLVEKGIIYVGHIFKDKAKDFILLFGLNKMAKFLKDFAFITKIMTAQIITFPILKLNQGMSIYPFMLKHQKQEQGQEKNLMKSDILLQYGINQNKEENGIQKWQRNQRKNGNGLKSLVQYVINKLKFLNSLLIGKSIALTIVKLIPGEEEWVYDLAVPEAEHFTIEGGIVVHNCADIDKYLLQTFREKKAKPPKTYEEKRMEEFRKKRLGFVDTITRLDKFNQV